MYRIPGLNDEESNNPFNQYLQEGLLGEVPLPEGFQAQQAPVPELAQGLLGDDVTQQMQAMSDGGSDTAQEMAALGQHLGETAAAAGRSRIAQQQAANQAAMQQDQQSKGGGLLGFAMNFLPWGKWLGNAGKAIGKAVGL